MALFLLVGSALASGASLQAHAGSAGGSLSVSVVPPVLPADGGDYRSVAVSLLDSSGHKTVALADTTVYLSSSSLGVASLVSPSIVIHKGSSFALANLTTTSLPGSAQILATSPGINSGSSSVSTVVPTGYPTQISLVAVPSSTAVSLTGSGSVLVELLDSSGMPAEATAPVVVTLMSSNPSVLNTSLTQVTVQPGRFLAQVAYFSGYVAGSADISAESPGLGEGDATVTVVGPTPLSLQLFAQPDNIVQDCAPATSPGSCTGRLVVMLMGPSGSPAPAQTDTVVQLRSSSEANVTLPSKVTVPAGQISAVVTFTAHEVSTNTGMSEITGSADGLTSSIVTVNTYKPEGAPMSLALFVGPNPILADHGSYSSVVTSLLNDSGYPTVNASAVAVTITSSDVGIGNFSSIMFNIPAGAGYGSTTITSTFSPGATGLTASARNLLSAQTQLTSAGSVPAEVSLQRTSQAVPANGGTFPAIEVSLESDIGQPAIAPTNIPVFIESSQGGVAQVPSLVVIPQGRVSVVVNVTTSSVPGTTNITAYTTVFGSESPTSWSLVTSVSPSPSTIAAYLDAPTSLLIEGNEPSLYVQLQDAAGTPARAAAATVVQVVSSNSGVINSTLEATIQQGADYVVIPLSVVGVGTAVLTVTSPGLATAPVTLTATPIPVSIQATASPSTILVGGDVALSVSVSLDGQGVQGAQITWTGSGGTIVDASTSTNSGGQGAATFASSTAGGWVENVTVYQSALGHYSALVDVIVNPPPPATTTEIASPGLSTYVPYAVVALVALGIVVLLALIVRSRRTLEELDIDTAEGPA